VRIEEGGSKPLIDALMVSRGNISRAAARLGIPRNTLRYRMATGNMSPPAGSAGPARRYGVAAGSRASAYTGVSQRR
jgi:hypothetical protein